MNHIDVKAYAVGEMGEADKRSAAAHVASCEACSEELASVQLALSSLATLRDEEVPRRIAFVSDKVFEPRWWQRMFSPTFASACVLAGAIVFHAYANQGPDEAEIQAVVQQQVDQAVSRQMEGYAVLFEQQDNEKKQEYKARMGLVTY